MRKYSPLLLAAALIGCSLPTPKLSQFETFNPRDTPSPNARGQSLAAAPATPEQLLRNIKIAIDNSLFLDEDFYGRSSLQGFSGGQILRWTGTTPDGGWSGVEISGFSGPLAATGLRMSIQRSEGEEYASRIVLSLRFPAANGAITLAAVDSVFGVYWQNFPATASAPGLPGGRIRFLSSPPKGKGWIVCSFDSTGTLTQLDVTFEGGIANASNRLDAIH
jgi:hypothetical protein